MHTVYTAPHFGEDLLFQVGKNLNRRKIFCYGKNIEWVFLKIYDFFTGYSGFNIGSLSWIKTTIIVILLIVTIIFVYVTVHSARALKKEQNLEKKNL